MSFKRFREQDLIHTTIKTHPEYNFIINKKVVFLQRERVKKGKISDLPIKHVPSGNVSLYELNIDRGDLVIRANGDRGVVSRSVNAEALVSLTHSKYDLSGNELESQGEIDPSDADGGTFKIPYPMSGSISRIFVPTDNVIKPEYDLDNPDGNNNNQHPTLAGKNPHPNRKYITALENVINFPDDLQNGNFAEDYKLRSVNMICIPGIFYGSEIKKKTIKLDYFLNGSLLASAEDSDGNMICTVGPEALEGQKIGDVIYNQGLILLNNGTALHETHTDEYNEVGTPIPPSWLNFGTGIKELPKAESQLNSGLCATSAYSVSFQGTNKIPSLTMFAFSEIGEHNFSNNPTFLNSKMHGSDNSLLNEFIITETTFEEPAKNIKSTNKSPYIDHSEDYESTTYISKVGIYDEEKNLIAVATLANPAKKTEKRDFMIKMKIDF